jgi:hypothetical protein
VNAHHHHHGRHDPSLDVEPPEESGDSDGGEPGAEDTDETETIPELN